MKQSLLLPNRFKKIGWIILIPSAILGVISIYLGFEALTLKATVFAITYEENLLETRYFGFFKTNIANTLIGIFFIAGALLLGFSKEKNEDEYILSLRQSSLLWAVLVNYLILILCFAFIYGTAFLNIMLYNMFTILIIYIARFNFVLYRNAKSVTDEKHN